MWADFTEDPRESVLRLITTDLEFSYAEGSMTPPKPPGWDAIKHHVDGLVKCIASYQAQIVGLEREFIDQHVESLRGVIFNEPDEEGVIPFDGDPLRTMYESWRAEFLSQFDAEQDENA